MTDFFDGWMGTRIESYPSVGGPRVAIIGIEASRTRGEGGVVEVHHATHSPATLLEIIESLRTLYDEITGRDPSGFDGIVAAGLAGRQ